MKQLFKIQIVPGIVFEAVADVSLGLRPEAKVVVRCEFYQDVAVVKTAIAGTFESLEDIRNMKERQSRGRHVEGHVIPEVLRLATDADLRRAATNAKTAEAMHRKTVERIRAHKLEMRLIQSHYSMDSRLLLCQFTADGRVDFRELLRDLSALFRTRIELRQVGVRDEAAIIGGVGACGRPYCCATFLHNIASVNVRMAKQQGISLTPQNISGACGRLKCCLHFEHPLAGEDACGAASEREGEASTAQGRPAHGEGVQADISTRRSGVDSRRRRNDEDGRGRKNGTRGDAPRRGDDGVPNEGTRRVMASRHSEDAPKTAPPAAAGGTAKSVRKRPGAGQQPEGTAKSILPLNAVGIVPLRSSAKKNADE